MTSFYTNVALSRNDILLRGFENGRRVMRRIPYKPYLFLPDKKGEYTAMITGQKLSKMSFDNIREVSDFIERYKDTDNFEYHGSTRWQHMYITDAYPGLIDYDPTMTHDAYLDIEVDSEGGFPNIELADKKVTAITVSDGKEYHVFGYGDFMTEDENITYHQCRNEKELLYGFLRTWRDMDIDCITGWNVEGFDLPYLYVRIANVLGEEEANKLSPWNNVRKRKFFDRIGREVNSVNLSGVCTLDYMKLYLKFMLKKRESYALDFILKVEKVGSKIDYKSLGYKDLADLYKRNHQLFIEYNIEDVRGIINLDAKMKYLDLAKAIAFDAKINFDEATTSVLLWDNIIINYLMPDKIIVPRQRFSHKDAQIAGAYVKEPEVGQYDWVVSFDVDGEYPHVIMQNNVSPEKYCNVMADVAVDDLLEILSLGGIAGIEEKLSFDSK